MNSNISVSIPTKMFLELVDFLKENDDPRDPVIAIHDAIDYWMQNASWKPELLLKSDTQGYQWKNVFLPSGTELRMQYKGDYYYAKVEGDSVMYNGRSITPSVLANTVANGSRNAWRDIWVKRPGPNGDTEWKLADDIRQVTSAYKAIVGMIKDKNEDDGLDLLQQALGNYLVDSGLDESAQRNLVKSIKARGIKP
jgi:hypothetical protein